MAGTITTWAQLQAARDRTEGSHRESSVPVPASLAHQVIYGGGDQPYRAIRGMGLSFQAWIADPAAAHTRRSTGCDGSTQACLTGPIPLTVMTAG